MIVTCLSFLHFAIKFQFGFFAFMLQSDISVCFSRLHFCWFDIRLLLPLEDKVRVLPSFSLL
jgi:hypothetical protein